MKIGCHLPTCTVSKDECVYTVDMLIYKQVKTLYILKKEIIKEKRKGERKRKGKGKKK